MGTRFGSALRLKQMAGNIAGGTGESTLYPKSDGKWYTRSGSNAEELVGPSAASSGDATWTNATLSSPYTAVSGQTPQYRKDGQGNVMIRGAVNRNSAAQGSTIFTLPAGYRPSGLAAAICRTNNITLQYLMNVDTAGVVTAATIDGVPTAFGLEIQFSNV